MVSFPRRRQSASSARQSLTAATIAAASLMLAAPLFPQKARSFHELEQRALQVSPLVAAAEQKWQAAARNLSAARVEFGPEVTASYRYLPDRIDLTADELSATHSVIFRVGQDLIDLVKLRPAKIRDASARLEAARLELAAAKVDALYEFRRQYLDLRKARAAAAGQRRLSDLCKRMLQIVTKQQQYGEALLPDVYRVEKDRIQAEGLAAYNKERDASLTNALAEALRIDRLQVSREEIETADLKSGKNAILRLAERNYTRWKVYQANREIERGRYANTVYQDVHLIPYLGYRYRWKDIAGSRGSAEAGIRLAFPLLFPASRSRRENQFMAARRAWEETAAQARATVREATAMAFDDLLLAGYSVAEASKEEQLRREIMRIEKVKYARLPEMSSADRLRLLKLEVDVEKAEMALQAARLSRADRFYELLRLCGLLWPEDILPAAAAEGKPNAKNSRAIWVWKSAGILASRDELQRLVAFCAEKGLTRVFLSIDARTASTGEANLRKAVRELHRAGVAVSALIGDPAWVHPRNRAALLRRVRFISDYNHRGEPETRFDAIHLDVEPQALPEWKKQKKELLRELVVSISQARDLLQATQANLPLELDLPVFYDKVDPASLSKLISLADEVTVMAYQRTSLAALIRALGRLRNPANPDARRLRLGINVDAFSNERELRRLITQISADADLMKGLAGFAIHDYARYRRLGED